MVYLDFRLGKDPTKQEITPNLIRQVLQSSGKTKHVEDLPPTNGQKSQFVNEETKDIIGIGICSNI